MKECFGQPFPQIFRSITEVEISYGREALKRTQVSSRPTPKTYTQALMFYEKKPRADVDVTAQNSGGVNLGGKPAIQMKGVTQPQTLAVKVFRWIKEDTSEVFQQVARETAGFDKAADNV